MTQHIADNRSGSWIAGGALALTSVSGIAWSAGGDAQDVPASAAGKPVLIEYSPVVRDQNATNLYWGDTHLHTRNSADAWWGGDISVAEDVGPSFAAASFSITVDLETERSAPTGASLARGSWFGGLSFYLKDGRPTVLVAASERPDDQFSVSSGEATRVGTSSVTFRFSSRNEGEFSGRRMCIEVDGRAGGCGDILRMPAVDAGKGEKIDVGRDTGVPVTADYPTGGTLPGRIGKVVVETATQ